MRLTRLSITYALAFPGSNNRAGHRWTLESEDRDSVSSPSGGPALLVTVPTAILGAAPCFLGPRTRQLYMYTSARDDAQDGSALPGRESPGKPRQEWAS